MKLAALVVAATAACVAAAPTSVAASPAAQRRAIVTSVIVSPTYAQSHRVYAVRHWDPCPHGTCEELLRSDDGGGTWRSARASGWTGTTLEAGLLSGQEVLLSPAGSGLDVSMDGGDSFRAEAVPSSFVSVAHPAGTSLTLLTSTSAGRSSLLTLPANDLREVAGSDLRQAQLYVNPAYPHVPSGQPYAIAGGADSQTGFPTIELCDAGLRCTSPRPVVSERDYPFLFMSPRFDGDHVLFANTTRLGLFRSTDGGLSFAPVVIAPKASNTLIQTVQALGFTTDFDGAAHHGSVYAGVLGVNRPHTQEDEALVGGVYRSIDGGINWRKVGAPSRLDGGVTALAVAPDGRVFAAYLAGATKGVAHVLCTVDDKSWHSSCGGYTTHSPTRAARALGHESTLGGTPLAPSTASPSRVSGSAVVRLVGSHSNAGRTSRTILYSAALPGLCVAAAAGLVLWRRRRRIRAKS